MTDLSLKRGFEAQKKEPEEKESVLQNRIKRWCDDREIPCLSIPQMVTKYPKISRYFKDWPDQTIILFRSRCVHCGRKGRVILLEIKTKTGPTRPGQVTMGRKILSLIGEWYRPRTWKRFMEIINQNAFDNRGKGE